MSERVVVVGAGGISDAWFPPLLAEQVEIAAVVDLRLEAAEAKLKQYNLASKASTDLTSTLAAAKPDFVLDLTIPESHPSVTITALRAGVPVLGEKPLAPTMAEAREMLRVSEETGKLYMVSQNRRWEVKHEAVRRALAAGVIGEITTINCDFYLGVHFGGFREEMESPLLLDMAIHHFDLARFFTRADAVSAYAKEFNPKGSWFRGDVAASCIFELTNGIVFTYRGSWCSQGFNTSWNGDWRIIGSRGTLRYQQDENPRVQAIPPEKTGFQTSLDDSSVPLPALPATGMHGALREMLAYLRTGALPQTECHDNIKSLAMVMSALTSSRAGQPVPVD